MKTFEDRVVSFAHARRWPDPILADVKASEAAIRTHPRAAARVLAERHGLHAFDEQAIAALVEGVPAAKSTVWYESEGLGDHDTTAPVALTPARLDSYTPPNPQPGLPGVPLNEWFGTVDPGPTLVALFASVAAAHAQGVVIRNLAANRLSVGPLADVALPAPDLPSTPAYTSPEQAADPNALLTPASDVFALGSILFEAYSGAPLFAQISSDDTLADVMHDRRRAPKHPLPLPLAQVVARATHVDIHRRFPTARELLHALQHALSAVDGTELLLARSAATTERARCETCVAGLVLSDGVEAHERAWTTLEAARAAERNAQTQVWLNALRGDLPSLKSWISFLEHRGDADSTLDALLARMDELDEVDACKTWRTGKGRFSLSTDPPCSVDLYRFEERGRRLWPEPLGTLGTTPIDQVRLPMGSYVALLKLQNGGEIRLPVRIDRRQLWERSTPLRLASPRSDAEVFVPEGPFVYGTSTRQEPGFFIQKHAVDTRSYLEFLTSLRVAGQHEALNRCLPLLAETGPTWCPRLVWKEGCYRLEPSVDGRTWDESWPMVAAPFRGAITYARWKSASDELDWSLPTESQWEKAARGVDGRALPWGPTADPLFAVLQREHPEPSTSSDPDSSPYGVKGLGGNVSDWVLPTGLEARPGFALCRGGNYACPLEAADSARREHAPDVGSILVGFRLVRPL